MKRVVCDASAVIAMLFDSGPDGQWASNALAGAELAGAELAAPSLLGSECANIIRCHESAGLVVDQAARAHADLLVLPVELWPFELLAPRMWELRHNLSSCDASYVAVAEATGADLVTLDRRLARSPGLRCAVRHA